jgi:gas vesicle protein
MGETVEAISYKADVKSRVKESAAAKKDAVIGAIGESKDAVVGKADSLVARVGGIVPEGEQVRRGAAKAGISKENPLGLALAGAAVGFVVGTLLPRTAVEDQKLGEMSDEVTDKAKEAGQEAIERGKNVAEDALQAAADTAQDRGRDEAEKLKSSVQNKAQQVS